MLAPLACPCYPFWNMSDLPETSELTPLMKQYWDLKSQVQDALLFFRMGDFYELFAEDAVEAAKILEITLTTRDKNKTNPTAMAGVPHHSAQAYIQRLLDHGKKVAIGEQIAGEDASAGGTKSSAKTIVRREIVRVFTPAIQFDHEGSQSLYLATALPQDEEWILACLDPSTGESKLSDALNEEALLQALTDLPVKHFLRVGHQLPESVAHLFQSSQVLFEDLPSNFLSAEQAEECLKTQYAIGSLESFLHTSGKAQAVGIIAPPIHALGVLVAYVLKTQSQTRLAHLRLPVPLYPPKTMKLGPRTIQHLDLLPGSDATPNLYQTIDRTKSALGARQLRQWLVEPLKDPASILYRQDAVKYFGADGVLCDRLGQTLSGLYDLERIMGRVTAGLANPRDTLALGKSCDVLKTMATTFVGLGLKDSGKAPQFLADLTEKLEDTSSKLASLSERILKTQREDAPLLSRDGGIFNVGTSPELDRLLSLNENGQRWLIDLETQEREKTGIPSLKVRYNRVFGYYIEVTQAHLKNVPSHYQRKQTTVGAERFFTDELKTFEEEIITASTKQKSLEQEMFQELLGVIREQTSTIMSAAQILGQVDALISLAKLAQQPAWCFPTIDESMDLKIVAGRHPLVDTGRGQFVPNDLELSDQSRLTLMITGPNMGGKSTVMRQVALILILGQAGAPVPASSAHWGVVSSLYTRIGAHDAIARGQSTFMVEMSELAHILHHADARSFVVLDEIGRGTSTYDGISVAWSTLEWICRRIKCRTLFATHYHELTQLAKELPLLDNAHMAVEGSSHAGQAPSLRFLYLLKSGAAAESFGIHVARLAGLPTQVIDRAWKVLENLESSHSHIQPGKKSKGTNGSPANSTPAKEENEDDINQLSLFAGLHVAPAPLPPDAIFGKSLVTELEKIDINDMTPIQAMNFLVDIQGRIAGLK